MAQLRIGLAQVDPTVGDLEGNAGLVQTWTEHAAARGAHLVAFPEMMLTGYPVQDLALRPSFVEASRRTLETTAHRLAGAGLGDLPVIVGYLDRSPEDPPAGGSQSNGNSFGNFGDAGNVGAAPLNAAAVLHRGRVVARYVKHHLPNYGVFDEFRYFVPGDRLPVLRLHGVDVAIAICEDLWQDGGPVEVAGTAGAALLVVPNGSPYDVDKGDARLELVRRRAREAGLTLAYLNIVGGQDELVFDGGSLVVDPGGELLARGPTFEEACLLVDLDMPAATAQPAEPGPVTGPQRTPAAAAAGQRDAAAAVGPRNRPGMTVHRLTLSSQPLPPYEPRYTSRADPPPAGPAGGDQSAEVYAAVVTATRDYARKNGFATAMLALSGGIDSALTAAVAADALGPASIHVVLMPSRYSSEHSVADAEELARRVGLQQHTIPVATIVDAFEKEIELHGVAAENLQARVRGVVVMSLSNEHGHLVLATGNKSELAVGYSTLYGDTVGGFAPLKDVPKTVVWQLARWRNDVAESRGELGPIPDSSITKAPSAELRPGQRDVDSLPDYAVLDPLLDDYIERDQDRDALVAAGYDRALVDNVIRRVDSAEYKRWQYPPGPKITLKAFGRDRRLPITSRWRESETPR